MSYDQQRLAKTDFNKTNIKFCKLLITAHFSHLTTITISSNRRILSCLSQTYDILLIIHIPSVVRLILYFHFAFYLIAFPN